MKSMREEIKNQKLEITRLTNDAIHHSKTCKKSVKSYLLQEAFKHAGTQVDLAPTSLPIATCDAASQSTPPVCDASAQYDASGAGDPWDRIANLVWDTPLTQDALLPRVQVAELVDESDDAPLDESVSCVWTQAQ